MISHRYVRTGLEGKLQVAKSEKGGNKGMKDCESILTGDMAEYYAMIQKAAYERMEPVKAVFELTPRCNFRCSMCYVRLDACDLPHIGRERSLKEWLDYGEQAKELGVLELSITGGEPFILPYFRELYEKLYSMGFLIQLYTNGYLIDEDTVDWLKRFPPHAIRITLYGITDETYSRVCGMPDGFTKVSRAVMLLKNAGMPLYLVSTVTKENAGDFPDIYRFAQSLGLPFIHSSDLSEPVRGAKSDPDSHRLKQKLPDIDTILELRRKNTRYPRARCEDYLLVCSNYRRGFWITWNGKMQMCAFLTEPSVDTTDRPLSECWKELNDMVSRLRQPEICLSCEYEGYCERCPGLLYPQLEPDGSVKKSFCERARQKYLLYGAPTEELNNGN